MKKDLLVIGGGGHAKVVIDLALRSGEWRIAGVLDDAAGAAGRSVLGCAVLGGTERISDYSEDRYSRLSSQSVRMQSVSGCR